MVIVHRWSLCQRRTGSLVSSVAAAESREETPVKYSVSQKNHATLVLSITLANADRFSIFSLPDSARNLQ